MKLIIGLGNPGKQYEKTRHNAGFMVLDSLIKKFKRDSKLEALIAKEDNIIYAKPLTFMNESGRAVSKIARFYKIIPKNIYIIYDDKDLNLGTLRIRRNGSAGGHNGMKSIIQVLHTENFPRFRIGIKNEHPIANTADFVLNNFSAKEKKELNKIITKTKAALKKTAEEDIDKAILEFSS